MAIIISGKNIIVDGKLVFEAPGCITETAYVPDGVIIVYDTSGDYSSSDALKNVLKIDNTGKIIWRIKAGAKDASGSGYRKLMEIPEEKIWIIQSGKYEYYLDAHTGETTVSED